MLTLPAPIGTSGAHFFLVMRFAVASVLVVAATAFTAPGYSSVSSETQLYGLFDNWGAGGSGKDRLDEVRRRVAVFRDEDSNCREDSRMGSYLHQHTLI